MLENAITWLLHFLAAKDEFLRETAPERAEVANALIKKKDINTLHVKLVYLSEVITHVTGRTVCSSHRYVPPM